MARYSLILAATLFALSASPLRAQNFVNGTLDTNANGWTLGGGCGDEAWDGANGNPPGSIRLNACGEPDSDPTASQTVTGLVVGATYTVKVDVHLHVDSSGGGTGKSFGIFLNDEPANPILLTEFLDGNWHTVTAPFTATATSATIFFAAELDARTPGGPGIATDVSYFIDNISMIPPAAVASNIPTTSEQAVLVLGVLLAVCAAVVLRKRRNSRAGSR